MALLFLAGPGLAFAQPVRENVRVGLESVRLEVRGSDGKPIASLRASEVKLLVDGKVVPIEGLDAVGAAAPPVAPGAKPATAGQASGSGSSPPGAPSSDIYLDVLFDETATNFLDRRDVFRQLEVFLKEKTSAGVHVMLQRFDGRVRTECPWTADRETAIAALKKMQKSLSSARVPSPGELPDEVSSGRMSRDLQIQIDLAGRRSFDAVLQALIRFPDVPGRKALVFITDGTPLMTPYDLSLMLSDNRGTSQTSESVRAHGDIAAAKQLETALQEEALSDFANAVGTSGSWSQRMAKITNKATELDIALYPVDSEAPDRGTNPGVGSKWPGRSMPGVSRNVAPGGMSARFSVGQSMTALADATGGQPVLVPLGLADRLGAVVDDRTAGYVLTFRDPSPGDGKYHTLEVAVQRPGAKLTYRRGFRQRSDDERTLDAVVAHLSEPTSDNTLRLQVSFDVLRKEGGRDVVQMRMEFQPTEAPGDTSPEREIQYWAVCADDDGNRGAPIVRKSRARRVRDSETRAFTDGMQLGLPPGPYTWSIALRDIPTNVTSFFVMRKQL